MWAEKQQISMSTLSFILIFWINEKRMKEMLFHQHWSIGSANVIPLQKATENRRGEDVQWEIDANLGLSHRIQRRHFMCKGDINFSQPYRCLDCLGWTMNKNCSIILYSANSGFVDFLTFYRVQELYISSCSFRLMRKKKWVGNKLCERNLIC